MSRASILAAALALAAPAGIDAQWDVSEFEVVGYGRGALSLNLFAPFEYVADMVQTSGDTAELRLRREMEAYLREAARRLADWGFPEPALGVPGETVLDGRYTVFLADSIEGSDAAGHTHGDHCWGPGLASRAMVLDRSAITRTDAETGSPVLTPFGYEALGHELFHGVQHGMAFFESLCNWVEGEPAPRVGDWITEGTARAVGDDLVRTIRPGWSSEWGGRAYDRPLPVPLRLKLLSQPTSGAVDPYQTASFWRYLAELHAGQGALPWIGPDEAVDYGYLVRPFEEQTARDCNAEGAACAAELRWLDEWSIRQFGRSLKQLFPLFIETLALYGERGARANTTFDPQKGSNWRNEVFNDGCTKVEFERGGPRSVPTVVGRFHPNSARCWEVTADTLAEGAQLGITVIGPPGAPALSHLSVATGGKPVEADSPSVVFTGEKTEADWIVPALDTAFVFMTNVAPDPAESGLMENLPVAFTLIEPFATLVSISTGPGPSGADVDQPIGLRFEWLGQPTLSDYTNTRHRHDPGISQACVLNVTLSSGRGVGTRGDHLTFMMDHDGPIGPDTYPLADSRQVTYATPNPPGMVVAGFTVGSDNPVSGGHVQMFEATGGSLHLESVRGGFLRGVLDVNGENRLAERIALGDDPPDPYVPNATIRVEFGLRMHDPLDRVERARLRACLEAGG